MTRSALAAVVALVVTGCGASAQPPEYGPPPPGWPRELVVGAGAGPALYLGREDRSPAVGYVSPGVRVKLAGAVAGDRVAVRIEGPLKVRAFLATSRLSARIQKRGRIRGTPVQVTPNDW